MIGAEDVEVGLFGARVTVVTCVLQGFFKGQWQMPSTPEVNEIRLLSIGHRSSLRKLDSRNVAIAITGGVHPSPGALHIENT